MIVQRIDHIGIAVKSIKSTAETFEKAFGLNCERIREIEEYKLKACRIPMGDINVELLEPIDETSPIAKFLENRGEGLHHIAIKVNDIEETLERLKKSGIELIDEKPKIDAKGHKIAFISPESFSRVLIELTE